MKKFADTLRYHSNILLTTHVQPDGDGIGSEIALYRHLIQRGKKAWIINPSPTPEKFEIVDPQHSIQVFKPGDSLPPVDLVIIVDTNEVKMLGPLASEIEKLGVPIRYVDHHVKELQDTTEHLIDERSGSSGELVYQYLKSEKSPLDLEIALALYVAILTDTGNFRYQRTSSATHQCVSDLLKLGIKPESVFQSVFCKDSPEKLQLLGKTLQTLQISEDRKLAWVVISKEARLKCKATIEDTESFIGHLTVLKGIKIVALFREEDDGRTKLSLRGLGGQPVIEIAKKLGGGGHQFAAGAKVAKTISETVSWVLQEVTNLFEKPL